jgi:hypothetical protein
MAFGDAITKALIPTIKGSSQKGEGEKYLLQYFFLTNS